MNIVPLSDKVALVQLKNEATSASGIILSRDVSRESVKGKVLAIGPDVTAVKEGDVVLVEWDQSIQSKIGEMPFFLIREQGIIAVVE